MHGNLLSKFRCRIGRALALLSRLRPRVARAQRRSVQEARTLEHLDQVDEENQKIDKTLYLGLVWAFERLIF